VILCDVDRCVAEQCADAADDAGDVVVRKDDQRLAWCDVDVEAADAN
jgi:hypothetical protein